MKATIPLELSLPDLFRQSIVGHAKPLLVRKAHVFHSIPVEKWIAGTSPAMTDFYFT
jgi:hypothetical protein